MTVQGVNQATVTSSTTVIKSKRRAEASRFVSMKASTVIQEKDKGGLVQG